MSLTYLYNKLEKMDKWEQYCYIQNILIQFQIVPKYDLATCMESYPKNPLGYLVMHLSLGQLQELIPKYLQDLVGQSTFNEEDISIMNLVDYAKHLIEDKLYPNIQIIDPSETLQVFNFGSTKYPDWDFLNLNPYILVPAIFRHAYKDIYINPIDDESGLPHQAHIDSNLRMITLINEHRSNVSQAIERNK